MTKKPTTQSSVDTLIKKIETHIRELNKLARQQPKGFHIKFDTTGLRISAKLTRLIEAHDAEEE